MLKNALTFIEHLLWLTFSAECFVYSLSFNLHKVRALISSQKAMKQPS